MKKIIVAGDDLVEGNGLVRFLEKDFKVSTSCFEEGVLGLCLAQDFDLIITDYSLNDISGIVLIKKVKEVQPGIKSILISGQIIPDEGKIRRLGVDAFIKKPFELDILRHVIDLVLG